jgi:hypothetical protein
MKTVYFCDSTGKISGCATANTPEDEPYAEMGAAPGETIAWVDGPPISGDVQASHYFLDGVLTPRPEMSITQSKTTMLADGVDTITGIPAGSILLLGEQSFEVDDGEAEIDGYSGTVKITCWPYLDAEVVI